MSTRELPDNLTDSLATIIDGQAAHAALWHFDRQPGVWEPGGFTIALVEVITRADPENRARLALGFPELVAAVLLAQGRTDGIERLRKIARIGEPPGHSEACTHALRATGRYAPDCDRCDAVVRWLFTR